MSALPFLTLLKDQELSKRLSCGTCEKTLYS